MNRRDWKVAGVAAGVAVVIAAIVALIIGNAGGSDDTTSNQGVARQVTTSTAAPATTVVPSTTSAKPTTTSRSSSTTTTPPTLGAGVPDDGGRMDIFGLKLKLDPTRWEILEDQNFPARVIVISKLPKCTNDYKPYCPGFAIIDLKQESGKALLPGARDDNQMTGASTADQDDDCFYDGLHDGVSYHRETEIGQTPIGGPMFAHMAQKQCGGNDVLHFWSLDERVSSKRVVIVDTWLGSPKPVAGLSGPNELFSSAR